MRYSVHSGKVTIEQGDITIIEKFIRLMGIVKKHEQTNVVDDATAMEAKAKEVLESLKKLMPAKKTDKQAS